MQFPKNIDVSKITFGDWKVNERGGKSAYIGYQNGPLIIQTPYLKTPFGMSTYNKKDDEDEPGKIVKYTIPVNLTTSTTSSANFLTFLKDMDKHVLDSAVENSKVWFGKQQKEKVISAFYNSMVKYSKDKETGGVNDKYPPKFSIPVIVCDNEIVNKCFNDDKEVVKLNTIEKNTRIRVILQCTGMWLVDKKFGVSWKVVQLESSEVNAMDPYALVNSDDDDENVPNIIKTDDSDGVPSFGDQNIQSDDDEIVQEGDDEEEEVIKVEQEDDDDE